ncbi:hypothetical protein MTY66_61850 (plasmid) [Mycolicibacterium sp. TY66]|uniref:hypothetical protein n=1 Tax=unclassified Mycolicibacterium TaxID=2636767 RepID=UPI001BB3B4FE|nr:MULTISPECIES: hypothetical protein [unclassified Mycolicibacterium]BCI84560.1 hypothetical protein MTY66_61850 [Mycolicibacterium sp. TY66]BCJ84790.1 hypothetical protein MTY81_61630 [Mycolicibacterium sp. TY81]
MSTAQQAYDVLDRLDASGDRCTVAYQLADGTTRSIEGTMSTTEARVAVAVAADLGATRTTIGRFDS